MKARRAKPEQYAVAEGLHRIVLQADCEDPPSPVESIAQWVERMRRYEATLPREALPVQPDGYVMPYPAAARAARR